MSYCDNASVGVVIESAGRVLLLTRAKPPAGIAPPAGHVDDHGSPDQAARAEVAEEVGLTVTGLSKVLTGWRDNVCRRRTTGRVGHQWTIYRAQATGQLRPSRDETRGARWYSRAEVQRLADRTAAYAQGEVSEADWQRRPGLEPVWCHWLHELRLVRLSGTDLRRIAEVAARR